MTVPWLWAAIPLNAVEVILVILFIVIPAVAQLFLKARQAQQPPGEEGAEDPRERRVQNEIDEFLRKAAERRGDPQRPSPPAQAQAVRPAEPIVGELVEDEDAVGGRVNRQVEQYMDSGEFARRSAQMGGEGVRADEQFDQQAKQFSGKEISRLSRRPGESSASSQAGTPDILGELSGTPVAAIADDSLALLLTNPDSIRQMIIMNEVLRRPEERWG